MRNNPLQTNHGCGPTRRVVGEVVGYIEGLQRAIHVLEQFLAPPSGFEPVQYSSLIDRSGVIFLDHEESWVQLGQAGHFTPPPARFSPCTDLGSLRRAMAQYLILWRTRYTDDDRSSSKQCGLGSKAHGFRLSRLGGGPLTMC